MVDKVQEGAEAPALTPEEEAALDAALAVPAFYMLRNIREKAREIAQDE